MYFIFRTILKNSSNRIHDKWITFFVSIYPNHRHDISHSRIEYTGRRWLTSRHRRRIFAPPRTRIDATQHLIAGSLLVPHSHRLLDNVLKIRLISTLIAIHACIFPFTRGNKRFQHRGAHACVCTRVSAAKHRPRIFFPFGRERVGLWFTDKTDKKKKKGRVRRFLCTAWYCAT